MLKSFKLVLSYGAKFESGFEGDRTLNYDFVVKGLLIERHSSDIT